tara:strand:+ start:128 stop:376 length:249 start_codon:yes stop_codon:yes gene_type:complete
MRPKIAAASSVSSMTASIEAVEMVDNLLKRNTELEEIYDIIQPLLYELSLKVYKEDGATVTLYQLVEDSVKFLKGDEHEEGK